MPTSDLSDPPARRRPWRAVLAALALLVPLVPLLAGALLHGGASRAATVQTTATAAFTPVGPPARTRRSARPSHRASQVVVPGGRGSLIGYVSRPVALRSRPGGRVIAPLEPKTGFGSPTFVLVRAVRGAWLGVIDTAAGNHHLGWIRAAGVQFQRDRWSIHAHLARHELDILHDGRVVKRFPIATGKPSAPTPTGLYAVTDRLTTGDPEGPYGCCILALSAKAPHKISDWDGGNRIAIHSTPETGSIGYSVSHGCMRLSLADGEWLIRHIPLATPVRISSA